MLAIRVERYGGPEVLVPTELELPQPGPAEVRVRLEASGVNFIDVYQRIGRYPGKLPFIPGNEGAGVVDALGPGVKDFKPGDRVAYVNVPGSYAQYATVPAEKLVPVPAGLSSQQAAAALLQGMTAHFLSASTYPLKQGDTALVHAGAGGVGLLLTQLARRRGARVISTVSTEEKARLAREAGASEVILYTQVDFAAEARRLTGGAGVQVVYDSVGLTTFSKSLECLAPCGTMVLFGGASGPVPPLDPMVLSAKGSLFLTRPSLPHYVADRASLLQRAGEVLGWVASKELTLRIDSARPLREAEQAHRALEGRGTSGKLLLLPA